MIIVVNEQYIFISVDSEKPHNLVVWTIQAIAGNCNWQLNGCAATQIHKYHCKSCITGSVYFSLLRLLLFCEGRSGIHSKQWTKRQIQWYKRWSCNLGEVRCLTLQLLQVIYRCGDNGCSKTLLLKQLAVNSNPVVAGGPDITPNL